MRFVSLQVNAIQPTVFGESQKLFTFDPGVNIIFSAKNSVGKTTLIRLLLYSLGYSIPSTRGICFSDYETILTVKVADDREIIIVRYNDYIEIINEGIETRYGLPADLNQMHSLIFGIENREVIENLLGTFYIDQEKGWTLLNRGKVVGNIHFSIEAFLRGISGRTNDALLQRQFSVQYELRKYRYMRDVAKYKSEINKLGEGVYSESPADEIDTALEVLYCEKKPLEEELKRIKSVIIKNKRFEEYISSFKLRVKASSGEKVPVNKDTLVEYSNMTSLMHAKKQIVGNQIAEIEQKISQLKSQQDRDSALFDEKTSLEKFDSEISKIEIDALAIEKIIKRLEKERKQINDRITASIKQNNPFVTELYKLFSHYAALLGLDEKYLGQNKDYIFTSDLKSLSGIILYKTVFAFKLSYITLIQKTTGISLPIIIDSPSGREISKSNIDLMMSILEKEFTEHQIIIASIHNDYVFSKSSTIEIKEKLLPF